MKKSIKLLWMVLIALPMVSLTSCGDDEPEPVVFKDYSYLLGMSDYSVKKEFVGVTSTTITDDETFAGYYFATNSDNVNSVYTYFTYFDYDNTDTLITYGNVVVVDSYLSKSLKSGEIQNELGSKFKYNTYDTEDECYVYTDEKKNIEVWYYPEDNDVMYIDTKNLNTKAGDWRANLRAALRK